MAEGARELSWASFIRSTSPIYEVMPSAVSLPRKALPLNFITFRVKISKYEMGRRVSKNIQSIAREMEWPFTELGKEGPEILKSELSSMLYHRIKTFYYFLRPVMKISMA